MNNQKLSGSWKIEPDPTALKKLETDWLHSIIPISMANACTFFSYFMRFQQLWLPFVRCIKILSVSTQSHNTERGWGGNLYGIYKDKSLCTTGIMQILFIVYITFEQLELSILKKILGWFYLLLAEKLTFLFLFL